MRLERGISLRRDASLRRSRGLDATHRAQLFGRLQRSRGNAYVQRLVESAPVPPRAARLAPAGGVAIPSPAVFAPAPALARTPVPRVQRLFGFIRRGYRAARRAAGRGAAYLKRRLLAAARYAFTRALAMAGIDPRPILGLLARAGRAVRQIYLHPGRFLKTLIQALGQGFRQFVGNLGKHLKAGLMGWLLGALMRSGLERPAPGLGLLKALVGLVLQVLGITRDKIRQLLIRKIGERNVHRLERAWGILATAMSAGIGGLWTMMRSYVGGLKQTVLGSIRNWVVTRVITAGVTRLVSLFNPVTGLISIGRMLFRVVQFLQRAGPILFGVIAAAMTYLARGGAKKAADRIELALAAALPLAINLLAGLVGLTGLPDRIKAILGRVRQRVKRAIKRLVAAVARRFRRSRGRGRAAAGRTRADAAKARKIRAGLAAIDKAEKRHLARGKISLADARRVAVAVKRAHRVFKSIKVVDGGGTWDYRYAASPEQKKTGEKKQDQGGSQPYYRVGRYGKMEKPRGAGLSDHHVPPRVLEEDIGQENEETGKQFIGLKRMRGRISKRIRLLLADRGERLKKVGSDQRKHSNKGRRLSVIRIPQEVHDKCHKERLRPEDLRALNKELKAKNKSVSESLLVVGGELKLNPEAGEIRKAWQRKVKIIWGKKLNPVDPETVLKDLEKVLEGLKGLYRGSFEDVLGVSIAVLQRNLGPGKYRGNLEAHAKRSWKGILNSPDVAKK